MQHRLEFQLIKLVYSSFHYYCQALPSLPTSISPWLKALSGRLGRLDGFARYSDDLQLQAASIEKLANEVGLKWGRYFEKSKILYII